MDHHDGARQLGIYVFGHGGGVPNGKAGNTNFALVPDPKACTRDGLVDSPHWLLDVGPETLIDICGGLDGAASVSQLRGIVLTHAHTDHAGGLASLAWRFRFFEERRPILAAPAGLWPMLESQLVELFFASPTEFAALGRRPTLADYFEQVTLTDSPTTLGDGLTVTAFGVDHNIVCEDGRFPAFGLRVVLSGGPTVVFSGDTARVIDGDRFAQADALFHDCQFYDPGSPKAVHCPYPHLRDQLPSAVRERTWLAHTLWEPPSDAFEAGFRWAKRGSFIVIE